MMKNKGKGSQNSLVTKAQRNRGAGPTPLLLCVCVCLRGLNCLRGGVADDLCVCACSERQIGAETYCQRSRHSRTLAAKP